MKKKIEFKYYALGISITLAVHGVSILLFALVLQYFTDNDYSGLGAAYVHAAIIWFVIMGVESMFKWAIHSTREWFK